MTLPISDSVRTDPVSRRIHNNVHNKQLNATIIVIGKPGMGKSVVAQEKAKRLDPTFNLNRVVFSINEFLDLLDKGDPLTGKLKPGQAIVFDEVVTDEGAESRGAMSKTNKLMTYIAATFRTRRLIVFMCLPSLMQLDKNLREVNVTAIIHVFDKDPVKRKNNCKVFWCKYDPYTQFATREYPRMVDKNGRVFKIKSFWLPIPDKETIDAYQIKKDAYLAKNIARWNAIVNKDRNKKDFNMDGVLKEIRESKDPGKYMDKGKYSPGFIKIETGIGRNNADTLAKYLNRQLELKPGIKVKEDIKMLS